MRSYPRDGPAWGAAPGRWIATARRPESVRSLSDLGLIGWADGRAALFRTALLRYIGTPMRLERPKKGSPSHYARDDRPSPTTGSWPVQSAGGMYS